MNDELLDKLEDMGVEVEDTLDRLMGDEELYMEYLCQFPENQNIINLEKAIAEKDNDTAMKEVHTLKGVALNLGILPLVDACMDMLLDFRAGDLESAVTQFPGVQSKFKEYQQVIEQYRD